jgi:hypothetical protein
MPPTLLATELQKRIRTDPYTRSYMIDVSIVSSTVVLKGKVNSFYHKQMATCAMQEEIRNHANCMAHLFQLKNELRVK